MRKGEKYFFDEGILYFPRNIHLHFRWDKQKQK